MRLIRRLPLLLLALPLGPPGGSPTLAAAAKEGRPGEDSIYKHLAVYAEVLSLVERAYVEQPAAPQLVLSSIEGVLDALDPFSIYVPAAEVEAFLAARSAAARRSGLMILKERGVAYVASVAEGGPAERAGIERGRVVEKIQGQSTREMPLWRVHQLLGSPAGTPLDLELIGGDGNRLSVSFELAEFEPAAAEMRTVRGVPVLRVPVFSDQTPAQVDALLSILDQDRLVVDLRGVAEGEPAAGYAVAERFADGELGALLGRHGALQRFVSPVPPIWTGELALLVDRGTRGAAEVLATVLRQARGASLVGERTFGHAGRIDSIGLTSGARLELTGAFYTGPDLEPLSSSLQPDLRIRPDSVPTGADDHEPPGRDEVLERAIDLMLEGRDPHVQ